MMRAMKPTGEAFAPIWDELDTGVRELAAAAASDSRVWDRGPRGKWTAGQHAAHVGVVMTQTASAFEVAEEALRAGTLPPPPLRGLLQKLMVKMLAENGAMPRGAKTVPSAYPPERPAAAATLDALRRDAERHRVIGARLSAEDRERLWIANPIRPVWHYRLCEMMRVHAVHARHHRKQIEEIARGGR